MSASEAITITSARKIAQPFIQPIDRPERARGPRERRARVGVGAVEVFVGRGDEQHRDERHEQHRRGVHADALDGDDEAERRRERVGGRRRGDADDDVREVADRVFLQPLVHHALMFAALPVRLRCRWPSPAPLWVRGGVVAKVTILHRRRTRGAIPKTSCLVVHFVQCQPRLLTRWCLELDISAQYRCPECLAECDASERRVRDGNHPDRAPV